MFNDVFGKSVTKLVMVFERGLDFKKVFTTDIC